MIVADVMFPAGFKTPIDEMSTTRSIVDEFEHVEPTVTAVIGQSSIAWLLRPHGRRESTQCALVMARHPIVTATSPQTFQGEVEALAYPYWLATALTEPLIETATLASFEAPLEHGTHLSPPWRELVHHFVARSEPRMEREPALKREPEQARTVRAYRAFVELADWLGLTQAKTAALLDMGRTTPLAWEREGHEPQPARARRLYQTHALVSTLMRKLGREEMRRWMDAGNPSPLELIAAGDVTGADDLAADLTFGTAPSSERVNAWVDELTDARPLKAAPIDNPPRRVRRRPPRRRTR